MATQFVRFSQEEYAEYVAVDEGSALPIPAGFFFEQAASLPEVFATAWLNLFDEGALEKTVLFRFMLGPVCWYRSHPIVQSL